MNVTVALAEDSKVKATIVRDDRFVLEDLQDRRRVDVGDVYNFVKTVIGGEGHKPDVGGLRVYRVLFVDRVFERIPLRMHTLFHRFVLESPTPRTILGSNLPYPTFGRHGLKV